MKVRALGFALLALAACGHKDKPDAFVQATIKAAAGQPQALWTALPKSYQTDVNGVVQDLAGRMNEQLYNDGFGLLQKATKVLETKREFILGHPMVAGVLKSEDMQKGLDPTVRTLGRIANSDIATLAGLKKLDVEKFLAGPIAASMEDLNKTLEAASAAAPPGVGDKLKGLGARYKSAKVTIESSDATTAKVKVEVDGEKPETIEMVKVEDKWLPKEMVDAWPGAIAAAHERIAQIKIEPAMIAQFTVIKGTVDGVLTGLLAAKTQDDFNTTIAALTSGLGGGGREKLAEAPLVDKPAVRAPPGKSFHAKPLPRRHR